MAAAFDLQLQFLQPGGTDDGFTSGAGKPSPVGNPVWGSKRDLSDGERWRAGEVAATVTTRFRTHHTAFAAGITPRHLIRCEGRDYEIVGIKEIGRRRHLEFTAAARTDQ